MVELTRGERIFIDRAKNVIAQAEQTTRIPFAYGGKELVKYMGGLVGLAERGLTRTHFLTPREIEARQRRPMGGRGW